MAHRWLAAGERGAWTALLGVLVLGGAGDLYMLTIYPHGLRATDSFARNVDWLESDRESFMSVQSEAL